MLIGAEIAKNDPRNYRTKSTLVYIELWLHKHWFNIVVPCISCTCTVRVNIFEIKILGGFRRNCVEIKTFRFFFKCEHDVKRWFLYWFEKHKKKGFEDSKSFASQGFRNCSQNLARYSRYSNTSHRFWNKFSCNCSAIFF